MSKLQATSNPDPQSPLAGILDDLDWLSGPDLETVAARCQYLLNLRRKPQAPDPTSKREIVEQRKVGSITYQLEAVRCGKETCKKCPHGPYWYSYQRVGSRVVSDYIGKRLPNFLCNNDEPSIPLLLHKTVPHAGESQDPLSSQPGSMPPHR